MRNKIIFTFFLLISIAAAVNAAAAQIPPFNKGDRVLILAAHPDDETIGAAGAIQKAIKAGAAVRVVLYTNGDNNEPAFIIFEKRLTFRRGEFLHMGEVRRKETISALVSLGLSGRDIIFLGQSHPLLHAFGISLDGALAGGIQFDELQQLLDAPVVAVDWVDGGLEVVG